MKSFPKITCPTLIQPSMPKKVITWYQQKHYTEYSRYEFQNDFYWTKYKLFQRVKCKVIAHIVCTILIHFFFYSISIEFWLCNTQVVKCTLFLVWEKLLRKVVEASYTLFSGDKSWHRNDNYWWSLVILAQFPFANNLCASLFVVDFFTWNISGRCL